MSNKREIIVNLNGGSTLAEDDKAFRITLVKVKGLSRPSGVIESQGIKTPGEADSMEELCFNAAVDGVESLVVALACAGVDVTSKPVVDAINVALDAINNKSDWS